MLKRTQLISTLNHVRPSIKIYIYIRLAPSLSRNKACNLETLTLTFVSTSHDKT